MVNADDLRYTKIALSHGSGSMPALGFGTLIPDPVATRNATKAALEAGFRLLDTAERYRTEIQVGEAMQEVFQRGKIKREDVFVITKLWNTNHRPGCRLKGLYFRRPVSRSSNSITSICISFTLPLRSNPGDEQDPRDANGNVINDQGVTLLEHRGPQSVWWMKEGVRPLEYPTSTWNRCNIYLKPRGSNRPSFTSNPIRTCRNGTC